MENPPLKSQLQGHERPCAFDCGQPVSIYDRAAYQCVMGYVQRRAAGGPNHIAAMKRLDLWAHETCVERGVEPVTSEAQVGLFDG